MIPFNSALFALRCHVIDLLPTGLMFLVLSYALVIRAIFTSVGNTTSDSMGNETLTSEDLTYDLFNV